MEIQWLSLVDLIKSRKSVSNFTFKKLTREVITEILECGRHALDENINQPYRVNVVLHPTVKLMLSELSPNYQDVFETACCCLVIFLDMERSNDRVNDILAIGAFIENILLGVHAMPEIGAVLLSEIVRKKKEVNEIFRLNPNRYELMGVIAIGAIDQDIEKFKRREEKDRRPIDEFIDWF